jgi:hypothetical protein
MCHLSALALLSVDEIPGDFGELKPHLPKEVSEVNDKFENKICLWRDKKTLM